MRGTGGSKAASVDADDVSDILDDADLGDAGHYMSVQSALDPAEARAIAKSLRSVAGVASCLQAGDVEMRIITQSGEMSVKGAGVGNALIRDERRNACWAKVIYAVLGGLGLAALGLGYLMGRLLHEAKSDGTGPMMNDDAANILATWRDLSDDELWKRLLALENASEPPALVDFTYMVFTLAELAVAQAPWEEKVRSDLAANVLTSAEASAIRRQRNDKHFEFAEGALKTLLKGVDVQAAQLPRQSVIDALNQVKDLKYDAAKRADGSAYLDDDTYKALTRREKLLLLHYAGHQTLRLLDKSSDIDYEILYTFDPDRYWTAEQSLGFSSLKVDSKPLNIVLYPMTVDIDEVDWNISPPNPPAGPKDTTRPYRYSADNLKDGTKYTVDATIAFRPSPVLNAAAGKSLDKPPVKLSVWFTVDNSGP